MPSEPRDATANQTYRQEIAGGYCWSPKRNANGARNPFYEFMREVTPGDLVFSFVDTRIVALGIVSSYCYESPKPAEFGGVGLNWEAIGWRVRVNFVSLQEKIRPKDHIELLRGLLPPRYSPLQESGNGIQSIYLTELPPPLATVLIGLIGKEASMLSARSAESWLQRPMQVENADLEVWEHHIEANIESDSGIPDTEREALIVARRGQGLFKQRVMEIETRCRITGVTNPIHLRASHCKPWRDSDNQERLKR
jgi:putative restriction endonuclease